MSLKSVEYQRKYSKTPKGILIKIYYRQVNKFRKNKYLVSYSLKELQDKFLNDFKFNQIYDNWVKNGFKSYDKPSIDRINPYKGYELNNIQILTWKENFKKGILERAKKREKAVIMTDLEGNILKIFKSLTEAAEQTKLQKSLICYVLKGKREHTQNYKFNYVKD